MKNQIKPIRLNLNLIATFAAVVVVSLGGFANSALAANPLMGQEQAIIAQTNRIRANAGLSALTSDARLMRSAAAKANDMAAKGYFDHGSPEGYRMAYWINSTGYTYALAGENLAKGFSDLDRLMNSWVASPSHYKNLAEPKFTNIGVGMAEGQYEGQSTLFVVQHFGVEADQIVKDTAPLVSVSAPLVEAVSGTNDAQTIINSGPTQQPIIPAPQVKLTEPEVTKSTVSRSLELVPIVQASPSVMADKAPVANDSTTKFWPIFALILLSLVGYLDEFIPLWSSIYLKK